MNACATKFDIY